MIKSVDEDSLMKLCRIRGHEECDGCTAVQLAASLASPDLLVSLILEASCPIGFFAYSRDEESSTARIQTLQVDWDHLEETFGHILRGLRLQGLSRVVIPEDSGWARSLGGLFGFHPDGEGNLETYIPKHK